MEYRRENLSYTQKACRDKNLISLQNRKKIFVSWDLPTYVPWPPHRTLSSHPRDILDCTAPELALARAYCAQHPRCLERSALNHSCALPRSPSIIRPHQYRLDSRDARPQLLGLAYSFILYSAPTIGRVSMPRRGVNLLCPPLLQHLPSPFISRMGHYTTPITARTLAPTTSSHTTFCTPEGADGEIL